MKTIDLRKSLYELAGDYPEIVDIMTDLGFKDIAKPQMLHTVGRFMTISKGAAIKGIDLATIREAFIQRGYHITEEN